jgi:hypothetical protein
MTVSSKPKAVGRKAISKKIVGLAICAMLLALCASAATSLAENYVGLDQI